jgi:hypothetical protein
MATEPRFSKRQHRFGNKVWDERELVPPCRGCGEVSSLVARRLFARHALDGDLDGQASACPKHLGKA